MWEIDWDWYEQIIADDIGCHNDDILLIDFNDFFYEQDEQSLTFSQLEP